MIGSTGSSRLSRLSHAAHVVEDCQLLHLNSTTGASVIKQHQQLGWESETHLILSRRPLLPFLTGGREQSAT